MTEREQLLSAIAANPDEDTARLVFADWLEEQPVKRVPCPKCRSRGKVRDHDLRLIHTLPAEFGFEGEPLYFKRCDRCARDGTVPDTSDSDLAEFVRVGVELGVWSGGRHPREAELLAAHPEWQQCPCPECKGTPSFRQTPLGPNPTCETCRGTLDLFRSYSAEDPSGLPLELRRVSLVRGFPESVSCTLAEVMRTECLDCGGYSGIHCRPCEGGVMQWIPTRWATAVVRQTPVTKFAVTDREPAESVAGWWWSSPRAVGSYPQSVLPESAFRLLVDGDQYVLTRSFPTREAALDALFVALGKFVRNWRGR